MEKILVLLGCYIIGSIPTGYIIGKINNIEIREQGSKNVGATNVYRIMGKKWGAITFLIDFIKGFIPTYFVVRHYLEPYMIIAAGIFTILGHIFTPFLGFKGGKGVATSTGVFMVITPKTLIISIAVFIIIVIISRYVSLATLTATMIFLITSLISEISVEFKYMIVAVSIIIYLTHISNIKRLLKGKELKV